MKIVKRLLVLLIVACMLWIWPIHPFKEVGSVRSGDEGHAFTEPLAVGESITQSFKAADNNLIQLEFVVDYDANQPRQGTLYFELLDKQENVLFAQALDYAQLPAYKYSGPVINVRLKKGKQYTYRLTNLDITENMPRGVYTTRSAGYGLKKGILKASGAELSGELLTRITANKPLPMYDTLAIWGAIGMIGFGVYEVLSRIEHKQLKGKEETI